MPVYGGREIRRRMRLIVRNVRAEVAQALDEASEDLLSRGRQLAPQLSGQLIASGAITGRRTRDVVSRIVFFEAPYAVVRHEDFYNLGPISSVKSSPDGPIGRKYLQRPFEAHSGTYQKMIGAAVRRGIRLSLR